MIHNINNRDLIEPENHLLPNDHVATFFTLMGDHTPSVNSDRIWLNSSLDQTIINGKLQPKILALVADGTTGSKEHRQIAPGALAADFLSKNVAEHFKMSQKLDHLEFLETVLPQELPIDSLKDAYDWLIHMIDKKKAFDSNLYVSTLYLFKYLFLRKDCPIDPKSFHGKTAKEIAEKILIDENEFKAVFNLIMAICRSLDDFIEVFKNAFEETNTKSDCHKPVSSLTTLSGALDLGDKYMLFSIGDSGAFIVDDSDVLDSSVTFCQGFHAKKVNGIGSGFFVPGRKEIFQYTPAPHFIEGSLAQMEERLTVNFVNKNSLDEREFALTILTDGLQQSRNWMELLSRTLTSRIGNVRSAIKDILKTSLEWDDAAKKIWPDSYRPDDKTIVIIQKD